MAPRVFYPSCTVAIGLRFDDALHYIRSAAVTPETEIARRLAKLANAPFLKVEATKFTEVGYVGRDVEQIARRLRTGQVEINGGTFNLYAPFGGYKQSGNGREYGRFALEEYLETTYVSLPAG